MHHGNVDTDTLEALQLLSETIDKKGKVPSSKLDETLIIASWNIREFGRKPRPKKALHLVAEILGQFDLIAIVELREQLADIAEVLDYLGPYWDIVYSDSVDDPGGNRERLGFLYDSRAVQFNGFAGNVSPDRRKVGKEYVYDKSFWRPPYMASFCSGDFDFVALATHIRWGDDLDARKGEIERFAKWVEEKTDRKDVVDKDVIVFGDFNTEGQEMIDGLLKFGLKIPEPLVDVRTNVRATQHYDHILYLPKHTDFRSFTNDGGVLNAWEGIGKKLFPGKTDEAITYLLSDHYPIWMKLKTDNDQAKRNQLIRRRKKDGN
jgi:hypothetical protein